jgi:general stress protein YciG
MSAIKQYLSEIGRKGGQKSRRKLTKAQARAMVRARTAKRAATRPNDQALPQGGAKKGNDEH